MVTLADPGGKYLTQNSTIQPRAGQRDPEPQSWVSITHPGPQGELKPGLRWPLWPVLWSGEGSKLWSGILGSVNLY